MPNWCDCKLTITGPNRQAVLNRIKGDEVYVEEGTDWNGKPYREEYLVHFDLNKVIPMPKEVAESEGWRDWGLENWGCRSVYPDRQHHEVTADADVIDFCTPWSPPLHAVRALSGMFPDNTFLLKDSGSDLPYGTTLFRAGNYTSASCKWKSVTPVLQSGYHNGDAKKRAKVYAKMFTQAGLPMPVSVCEIKQRTDDFKVSAKHGHDKLPRVNLVVEFPEPVAGVVAIGTGRYSGLGIFANV